MTRSIPTIIPQNQPRDSSEDLPGEKELSSGSAHPENPGRPGNSVQPEIHVDLQRENRCGFPEAVFGEGKSKQQLVDIATLQLNNNIPVFVTRISDSNARILEETFKGQHLLVKYNPVAKTVLIEPGVVKEQSMVGYVPVLSAGTTDLPVVEEALETLQWMKVKSRKIMDVGVAGPHRLTERLSELGNADAIVVVAGMEGALPSVVAGHVDCPIVAVPTSVGYGANLEGVSALLSMLNSCAANVSVVNIDAGFKGAYVAGLIASRANRRNHDS